MKRSLYPEGLCSYGSCSNGSTRKRFQAPSRRVIFEGFPVSNVESFCMRDLYLACSCTHKHTVRVAITSKNRREEAVQHNTVDIVTGSSVRTGSGGSRWNLVVLDEFGFHNLKIYKKKTNLKYSNDFCNRSTMRTKSNPEWSRRWLAFRRRGWIRRGSNLMVENLSKCLKSGVYTREQFSVGELRSANNIWQVLANRPGWQCVEVRRTSDVGLTLLLVASTLEHTLRALMDSVWWIQRDSLWTANCD